MERKNKILVLFAHPAIHKSRVNKELLRSIAHEEGITIHKLYEEYPDFHIDVKREQNLLLQHDMYIWHHPFYWYGAPAILKQWIDLVLEHNFAYGRNGTALQDKKVMTAITTGGRLEAYREGGYNNFTINQLLAPFKQTAHLCHMQYLPPFIVYGTHILNNADIQKYAEDYKKILISLREDIFSEDEINRLENMNGIFK